MASEALHELESTASPARAAEAYSLRALALLAQNRKDEARDDAQRAGTLAAKASDRNPKYDAALAMAQVDLAEGTFADARKQLAPILSRSTDSVSVPYLLQARLTLGELGLKSGQAAAARVQITSLEKQAREKQFLLMARKAGALLTPSWHLVSAIPLPPVRQPRAVFGHPKAPLSRKYSSPGNGDHSENLWNKSTSWNLQEKLWS